MKKYYATVVTTKGNTITLTIKASNLKEARVNLKKSYTYKKVVGIRATPPAPVKQTKMELNINISETTTYRKRHSRITMIK